MNEKEEETTEGCSMHHSCAYDACGNHLFMMKASSKIHWKFVHLAVQIGSDVSKIKSQDAIKAFACCVART